MKAVEEKRQSEMLTDLLTISQIADDAFFRMKMEHLPENASAKEAPLMSRGWKDQREVLGAVNAMNTFVFEGHLVSKGVKDSFKTLYMNYFSLDEDCKRRGTTIEAEAKKALGE